MMVSIEVPVIRGGWLIQCVDSVLQQTSSNWVLSLLCDEGDTLAHEILQVLDSAGHPRIQVHFSTRLGIARARQFLTERSRGELIVPLDDDDVLEPTAVASFLSVAAERPWAGIIRGRRRFIDDQGEPVNMRDWFPFERRRYFDGATLDVSNHSQPYAIRRQQLVQAGGWQGYEDFDFLGEDCGCFARIEEVAEIELIDKILYRYRIHGQRTSLRFDQNVVNELWRRVADDAVHRREVYVRRVNMAPPFTYMAMPKPHPNVSDVDVIVPFWESNERELSYGTARPLDAAASSQRVLRADTHFGQDCDPPLGAFHRMELALSSTGPIDGVLSVALFPKRSSFSPSLVIRRTLQTAGPSQFDFVSLFGPDALDIDGVSERLELAFEPSGGCEALVVLHTLMHADREMALMRVFVKAPGHCRRGLERCLSSLLRAGVREPSIHVLEKQQTSSANRNEAFQLCSKPWVCFVDDDAELNDPSTLQVLLDATVETGAALCGPKLLTESRRIYSGLPFSDPLSLEARVGGMGDLDLGQHDLTAIVPWLPSTVLLTHRSVPLATGGFDEHYAGSQHEDADFCLRARSRGFRCCYAGHAAAIHYNALRNAHFTTNLAYFKRRWRDRPELFAVPIVNAVACI